MALKSILGEAEDVYFELGSVDDLIVSAVWTSTPAATISDPPVNGQTTTRVRITWLTSGRHLIRCKATLASGQIRIGEMTVYVQK